MENEVGDNSSQVTFVERNDVGETLAAERANRPFAVRRWRPHGSLQNADSKVGNGLINARRKDAVAS